MKLIGSLALISLLRASQSFNALPLRLRRDSRHTCQPGVTSIVPLSETAISDKETVAPTRKRRLHRFVAAASGVMLTFVSPLAARAATTPSTFAPVLNPQLSIFHELRLTLRLATAALLGAAIGKERADSQHAAAGIRTMSLVALGAAAYTLVSLYGFVGKYDTSRMASNVASGVGFVGAGVITTTTRKRKIKTDAARDSSVHGLTTAAAIWLSAAVGVTCGSGLYVLGGAASLLTIGILKIGKVTKKQRENDEFIFQEDGEDCWVPSPESRMEIGDNQDQHPTVFRHDKDGRIVDDSGDGLISSSFQLHMADNITKGLFGGETLQRQSSLSRNRSDTVSP